MMREIALFSGAMQLTFSVVLIVSLFRILLPYLVRRYQYGSVFHGFNWDSWLYSFFEFTAGFYLVFINYTFVFAGFIDFQRRMMMLKTCGVMIDPVKTNYKNEYRMFPTINFLDIQSLHSWFLMRQCLMDIGRKYMSRIFIYSSAFLGCYLFYAVFLLLQYFEFLDIYLS